MSCVPRSAISLLRRRTWPLAFSILILVILLGNLPWPGHARRNFLERHLAENVSRLVPLTGIQGGISLPDGQAAVDTSSSERFVWPPFLMIFLCKALDLAEARADARAHTAHREKESKTGPPRTSKIFATVEMAEEKLMVSQVERKRDKCV